MSNYTLQVLDDAPVLVFTVNEQYHIAHDHAESTAETLRILDQQPGPVAYISNLLRLNYDFNEIVEGATRVSRGKNPTYHHPNMAKLIVVTTDDGLIQSYQGLNNPAFGNVMAHIFSTYEEALADAKASMGVR
ncbi:MAG: hypothetical protein U0670_12775 [Anaerolineae bacterium]